MRPASLTSTSCPAAALGLLFRDVGLRFLQYAQESGVEGHEQIAKSVAQIAKLCNPSDESKKKKRKRIENADGEAKPKRPMSAYLLFCQKHRDQIVKENVRSALPSRCRRQPLLTDPTSA